MAATVISFINLKGGVGKTTLAVNIGATIAEEFEKKVLIVDTDPQTNATISVISQLDWQECDNNGQTLYWMFNDLLESEDNFDIDRAIIKGVSDIDNLDLLPSSLRLVEIQDRIPDMDNKAYVSHVDVLSNQLAPYMEDYDYIIIDCPPNLGAITLNGISMSDYYVIPTVPDILSKMGISLIVNRIDKFKSKKKTCNIEMAGIIFTKVDYRTNLHKSTMIELREKFDDLVFKTEITQRIAIAEAPAMHRPHIKMPKGSRKGDWSEIQAMFRAVSKELLNSI